MTRKEFIFRNVISNLIICAVIGGIMFFSFQTGSENVSGEKYNVISKGQSDSSVSLMFNVYWGTEYLDEILTILDENNVKTTFFVGGTWVRDNDEMLQKIYSKGHEIGNHGFFHKDHKKINEERNREEISVTHKLVSSVIDYNMNLFAPPSGSFSKTTVDVAHNLGYRTIMWTHDTIDWRDKDSRLIYTRATSKISAGDLVLMHPTRATTDALDKIIKEIIRKNLKPATVTQTLG